MTNRIVGIDCYSQFTDFILASATSLMKQKPTFCGRYFTSPTTTSGAEYKRRKESKVFNRNNVLVLPIARQTNHVDGSFVLGQNDGIANSSDLVASFGGDYLSSIGGKFRIFLDVEGDKTSQLSTAYYQGWCDGLKRAISTVEFLPCLYGLPGDARTWRALQVAIDLGCQCHGVWLARPYKNGSVPEPVQWNEKMTSIFPLKNVPKLLQQYMFPDKTGQLFDRNIVNPNIDVEEFLKTLILSPEE